MRVKHFTGEPKSRQRHPAEQGPERCRAVIDLPNECPPDKIVLVVLNSLLPGCPSGSMKERTSRVRIEERIPSSIKKGVNPDRLLRPFGSLRPRGSGFNIGHYDLQLPCVVPFSSSRFASREPLSMYLGIAGVEVSEIRRNFEQRRRMHCNDRFRSGKSR